MSDGDADQRRQRRQVAVDGGVRNGHCLSMRRRSGAERLPVAQAHLPYRLMEEALDKLMILNYEKEFLGGKAFPPLSRTHFAAPGPNPRCAGRAAGAERERATSDLTSPACRALLGRYAPQSAASNSPTSNPWSSG